VIIKFTVTLSDATVAAFAAEGATTGQDIKDLLVEAIQQVIDETTDNQDNTTEDDDDTEDDEVEP
jgi:hypothetical protein